MNLINAQEQLERQQTIEIPLDVHYQVLPTRFEELTRKAAINAAPFTSPKSPDRIPSLVCADTHIAWNLINALTIHIKQDKSRNCSLSSKPTSFMEWGSGLGTNACIASALGWNASGLELERALVKTARKLAAECQYDAQFFEGSYKPLLFDSAKLDATALRTKHGFGLFDFDVLFGYFWPAEIENIRCFFSRHANSGCYFLIYKGGIQFELLQKL